MIGLWKRVFARTNRTRPAKLTPRKGLICEALEQRQLLDGGAGRDYVLSGFKWANPSKITYSFPADGVNWDYGINNLNATLTSQFSNDGWKREFAKALQTWASAANINVVPVSDSNVNFNAYGKPQGDPNFGDIRVGGYRFDDPKILAQTYYPPPNSVTAAGDVEVNTGFDWKPGAAFDFYSVMLHETGHSLGISHSPQQTAVMNEIYGGVRTGLLSYDIAAIQDLYGARVPDTYGAAGRGTNTSNAVDVSSYVKGTSGSLDGIWLTSIGETDYYTITVPSIKGASLQVTAAAAGYSSLSPKITVFDASANPLASKGEPERWSNDVSVAVADTTPGERYIVAVTGATNDVFAVGAYQLRFNFIGGTSTNPVPPTNGGGGPNPAPIPTPKPTPTPPVIQPDRFELRSGVEQTVNLGSLNQTVISGLTLHSSSDVDSFRFQANRAGTATLLNTGSFTRVLSASGQVLAAGTGTLTFRVARAGTRYVVLISSQTGSPVSGYSVGISIQPTASRAPIRSRKLGGPSAQTVTLASSEGLPTSSNPISSNVQISIPARRPRSR